MKVAVEEPEPGAAIGLGLKPTVTPVGWPEADSEMELLKPPETAVVTVEVPLLPWATEIAAGEAEIVKSGVTVMTGVTDTQVLGTLPHASLPEGWAMTW